MTESNTAEHRAATKELLQETANSYYISIDKKIGLGEFERCVKDAFINGAKFCQNYKARQPALPGYASRVSL